MCRPSRRFSIRWWNGRSMILFDANHRYPIYYLWFGCRCCRQPYVVSFHSSCTNQIIDGYISTLQAQFIADHVESQCNAIGCQQLVMEALKWHLLPERRSQVSTKRTRPRKSTMGKLLAVGGMDAHKGAISIESYCPRLDRWTMLKNMTGRRLQFGVAVIEDKLIIVGGRDGLKTLNSVSGKFRICRGGCEVNHL